MNKRDAILRESGTCLTPVPSALSYTLAEIELLADEFLGCASVGCFRRHGGDLTPELLVNSFLAWLARREREVGDGQA